MDALYTFVYRGLLTEESLDKAGRQRRRQFGAEQATKLRQSLSFEMLDPDLLATANRMAIAYTAVHAFENTVRELVKKAMAEAHGIAWWSKVPEKVQKRAKTRMEEDAKFKWHGTRGASEILYCDFGDLSSIIITNWAHFESILRDLEWTKALLDTLERSRNIVMHGGSLSKEDLERIGMNIRDWIRQSG
jgi:hypothetical protein